MMTYILILLKRYVALSAIFSNYSAIAIFITFQQKSSVVRYPEVITVVMVAHALVTSYNYRFLINIFKLIYKDFHSQILNTIF